MRRHAVAPTVAVRIWLRGGQLSEPDPGLGAACGRLLVEGTSERDWSEIVGISERRGMDVRGFGAPELVGLAVDALAQDWVEALELACEMALEPSFPEHRCQWVRRQMRAELESLGEQPEVIAGWAFLEQLYGDHPWSRPLAGTPGGLDAVEPGHCADFHRASLERGVIVSVVGEIDEGAVAERLDRRFAPHVGSHPRRAAAVQPPQFRAGSRRVVLPPADQAQVLLGRLTVAATDPDFVPLEVASVVLGSGPGLVGRLPERIRERDGLAYVVSALAASGAGSVPGRLVVQAGTAPDKVDALVAAVRDELARLVEQGVSDVEFADAKRFLLGSEPFRRETARQVAGLQAQSALLGLPIDNPDWLGTALDSLTIADLEGAIRRHLDPGSLAVTIGTPRTA